MHKNEVLRLIDEKLQQVEEAEKATKWNDKVIYGVHLQAYKQSPLLQPFLKKRKNLKTQMLLMSIMEPLMAYLLGFDFYGKLEQNPWIALIGLIGNAVFIGLVAYSTTMVSLVRDINKAQNDVKKMMLLDLREKIEKAAD